MLNFILYTCLVILILYVTKINNLWGMSKATNKARVDVRSEKKIQTKRLRLVTRLERLTWVGENVGRTPTDQTVLEYNYKIARLRWNFTLLNRPIKAVELIGVFRVIMISTSFFATFMYLWTGAVFFLVFFLGLFTPAIFNLYALNKISNEDKKLEEEFPDFFLILYNRLIQGTKNRLAPALRDFLNSLDNAIDKNERSVIRNFVVDLRNNIEVYGDDSLAVKKLREKYRSVMIVNFCNLAIQALNGVDNKDKLFSFKMELNQKRLEIMKKRADYLVSKGSRAIYLVYLILLQFILLSWWAKLSLSMGGLKNMFGL